jgi:hypothetical protein
MKTFILNPTLRTARQFGLLLAVLICIATLPVRGQAADKEQDASHKAKIVKFDVAQSGARFVFDEAPVFDDGLPAYGNAFVTEGYLFPHGYLDKNPGVGANGLPVKPEDVIGRWSCRGWFVGNGAKTDTGPWVITTQLYDLGDTPGSITMVTDGLELVDKGVPGKRAVTGGTGPYLQARGEAQQILLGHNVSEGVDLRVEITVVSPKPWHRY